MSPLSDLSPVTSHTSSWRSSLSRPQTVSHWPTLKAVRERSWPVTCYPGVHSLHVIPGPVHCPHMSGLADIDTPQPGPAHLTGLRPVLHGLLCAICSVNSYSPIKSILDLKSGSSKSLTRGMSWQLIASMTSLARLLTTLPSPHSPETGALK